MDLDFNVSFSGCGFLGIYHVGVASAIKEYAPQLTLNKVSGASAGAIAACGLICNMCLGQATSDVLKIVIQARQRALGPLHPSFNLMKILRQGLMRNLPPDAHKTCTGRLHISLTRFADGQNVVVSDYDSNDELVQALICSAFIPFYCGTVPPTFKGVRYIDGGWSDNLPQLNENTITVSPFSGESDICPLDSDSMSFFGFDLKNTNVRFTARNMYRFSVALFPPHPEIMSQMCREGFEDALRFLARHNLIACTRCIAVRSSIMLDNTDVTTNSFVMQEMETTEEEEAIEHPSKLDENSTFRKARDRYASSSRLRLLSEQQNNSEVDCEHCRSTRVVASKAGLPVVVKDTLADAESQERNWLSYIYSMRPVKLMRYLTIPWLLPLDLAYAACTKFLEWLPFLPEDSVWFANQASDALRFILNEIEVQRSKSSSRLTCYLNVTDLSYTKNVFESTLSPRTAEAAAAAAAAGCTHDKPDRPTRKQSTVEAPSTGGQRTVTEVNFGFSVDVKSRSTQVRQLSNIVQRDNVKTSEFPATAVATAAQDLEMEGLKTATQMGAGGQSTPVSDVSPQENFDTYASILNFTQRHEALMEYYYLDENKQVKVTKIFGLGAKNLNDFPNLHNTQPSRPASRRQSIYSAADLVVDSELADSGVGEDAASTSTTVKHVKKDASCSPVEMKNGVERSQSFSKYRRMNHSHHPKPRAHSHSRKSALPFVPSSGTASDSETENLFVPGRRRRRRSSNEAAYEAENSSEE